MDNRQGTFIVLLNWNGWRDTIACLESLLPDLARGVRIVVCDNASTDGSLDHIEAWARDAEVAESSNDPRLDRLLGHPLPKPRVQRLTLAQAAAWDHDADDGAQLVLIENGANLGFAAGNNVGLRYALHQQSMTHVWLLNNDTLVEPDCLGAMHQKLQGHAEPAVCGSIIHFFDDPEVIQCIGGNRFDTRSGRAMESEGRLVHESALAAQAPASDKLDYLSGCSMLLPRLFLETVGLMNEAYFLYYEEIDWFTRAGGRFDLLVASDARLYHREGGSIGSRSWHRSPSLISDRHMFRSRICFMRRYYPQWLWRCTLSNCLDVARRLLKGQWRNALVISREIVRKLDGAAATP